MIVKSYEVKRKISSLLNCSFFLLYGENFGLKKDIKEFLKEKIKANSESIEIISFYEDEIISNEENFYNMIYSGSLFSEKKIITIYEVSDKIIKKISDIYEKCPENIILILFSKVLEKKSKLRNFFEKNEKTVCIPCYLDSEKDLNIIANAELKNKNISLSREAINLLIEKSNADRHNLKNEIDKIIAYALNKKNIGINEVRSLINFSGDYKSEILINECLCGNISQYKKVLAEMYTNTVNQILLLRILSNKIQRLLKIKEQENNSGNLDNLINSLKPSIFWKDKPLIKKQLTIWSLVDLKKIVLQVNNIELLCKKNPQISKIIFFKFFSEVCVKANNFS